MAQLSSIVLAKETQKKADEPQRNWARNFNYGTTRWHYPKTVQQVQEIVSQSSTVKAIGSRHSFSTVADTTGDMISLQCFPHEMDIDRDRQTVTVNAGVTYGELCVDIDREGFAFHNMASLPHIVVAGACSTATHGSGEHSGLATSVAAIEFVTASGELVKLSRDKHSEQFFGAVVALGGLGVIIKLTLDVVPAFTMRQYAYERMPWSQVEAHFDEIQAKAYSVSLFLDWNVDYVNQVWIKYKIDEDKPFTPPENEWFGATLATEDITPFMDNSVANCTEQRGIPSRWYDRLPHFRVEFIPGKGEELQSEFFVPREHAVAALKEIRTLRKQIQKCLFCSEIRTIPADTLWMSPAYKSDSVSLQFTWKPDAPGVLEVLPHIEAKLAPFKARPHWAKVFTMQPSQVQALYPKLRGFQNLLNLFDPDRKFTNPFLEKYIYPELVTCSSTQALGLKKQK